MRQARWIAIAGLLGVVVLAVVLASRFEGSPGLSANPAINRPVSAQLLPLLGASDEVGLPAMAAESELLIVNFWASWCAGCEREHADLLAVADTYSPQGVSMVGVLYQDSESSGLRFLAENGSGTVTYVADPTGRAAIDFGVLGLPETFIVDRNGTIKARITGETNALVLSEVVEQVLAGETPGVRTVGELQQRPGS